MRDFLVSNLDPRTIVSWPVFLVSLSWSIITHFLDTVHNPSGFIFERLAVLLTSHLAMFAFAFVLVELLLRLPDLAQSLLMPVVVAAASSLRGLAKWFLLVSLGFDDQPDFVYRVVGAITNLGIPVILSAIVLHKVRIYSQLRQELIAENERLIELQQVVEQRAKESAALRLEQIKEKIKESLNLDSQATSAQAIKALDETIDNVVRPISHQIDSEVGGIRVPPRDVAKMRLDWLSAVKNAFLPRFIWPRGVGLSLATIGFLFNTTVYPLAESIYLIAIAAITPWLVLWLVKKILTEVYPETKDWVQRIVFVLGVLLAGFLTGSMTLPATLTGDEPVVLFFIALYMVIGLAALFALASSTQEEARKTNENLQRITEGFAWEVARISEEQRQLRRALAHALHGPLQAGLTSAKIRLQSASALDPDSLEQVDSAIRAELRNLVESVSLQSASGVSSLDEILKSLNQTWDGVAKVSLELDRVAESSLSGDLVLMSTLNDLLNELTFNAIKHGGATKIQFAIGFESPNTISLVCLENGNQPAASGRIGLGTKLLDECALSWSRTKQESGTKTAVILPFARQKVSV